MATIAMMILDAARPRAGPLQAAAAPRRRVVGRGSSKTLRHPQVSGNGTGLVLTIDSRLSGASE